MKINSSNILHFTISGIFIFIVLFTFLNQFFLFIGSETSNENRKLANKPILTLENINSFPTDYEAYFNDHFSLKAKYVSFMSFLSINIYKKAALKWKVIRGQDDWLFEMKKDLPLFLGDKTFTQKQLKKLEIEFAKRQEYFNSRSIKMYILICPSKYSVYPEKLPFFLKYGKMKRTDLFINKLSNIHGLKIIDGRTSLKSRKNISDVYLKYDTHWNGLGSFYAISDLTDTIRKDFPNLPKYTLKDFKIDTITKNSGNLKYILANKDQLFEYNYELSLPNDSVYAVNGQEYYKPKNFPYPQKLYYKRLKSTLNNLNLPKAIVFRDSYANFSMSYLPHYFKEIVYIWDNWQYKLNANIVEKEKPQVVIYMIYEGFIDRILMEPSFVKSENIDQELQ